MEKLSSSIITASFILGGAIIFTAWLIKPSVGRYTFSPIKAHWVLVGDTKTGKAWSCVSKRVYEAEDLANNSEFSESYFEGCLDMMVPYKVQKRVDYENR